MSTDRQFVNLEYRGKATEDFANKIRKLIPSVNVYFTTTKLKNVLPNLKCSVPLTLKSNVVYKVSCPGCCRAYIGQTTRHLSVRINEHSFKGTPVQTHFKGCSSKPSMDDVEVLDSANDLKMLLTLEALYIRRQKPELNTKEEFRSRTLSYAF